MTILNINLIAARRKAHAAALRRTRVGVYSLFGIAVCVVLLYFFMDTQVQLVQAQIVHVQSQLNAPELTKGKLRVAFLEEQMDSMTPRVELLEKVHASESQWIRIISDVGACTPPDSLWLTQMNCERSDKSQELSFRGVALEQRDVGRFMLALNQHGEWSATPRLSFTESKSDPMGGADLVDFQVNVPLRTVIGSDLK
jgi:Tfp pilus assembly protein PilN